MKFKVNPEILRNYTNHTLFQSLGFQDKKISLSTAHRWITRLGWTFHRYQKGIYIDGHERVDVVRDREEFIWKYDELSNFMPTFDQETLQQINPILESNMKMHVFITHDECSFDSHDGETHGWGPQDEQPLLKKGRGRTLMVSDFLCETIGTLRLSDIQQMEYPNISKEARVFFKTGTNNDGWWTVENLVKQV